MNNAPHIPVMLQEVLDSLNPSSGCVYVDGTFGFGGYTRAILESCDCAVIAIDRDESALPRARDMQAEFGDRFHFVQGCFGDVEALIKQAGFEKIDGFVLDIGVSSMQIDQPERGFSFRFDGPLDMRMTQTSGRTAADIVNETEESELADIIYKYGEERLSRRIAKAIVLKRAEESFETTTQLADLVRQVVRKSPRDKLDPSTRTFQALRIAVNDELGELERALESSQSILSPGGRLVVVTFHSLEDRIAKAFVREKCGKRERVDKYAPDSAQTERYPFRELTRKAILASDAEAKVNPRARSAKLRAIEFIGEGGA